MIPIEEIQRIVEEYVVHMGHEPFSESLAMDTAMMVTVNMAMTTHLKEDASIEELTEELLGFLECGVARRLQWREQGAVQ